METVKKILQIHGYDSPEEMVVEEVILVQNPGYMDLLIEKITKHRITVGHYHTKQGDLMCDPEIEFRIDGDEWIPVRYTQHPFIHQHDESGLGSSFVKQWNKNLERQGFVKAAKKKVAER